MANNINDEILKDKIEEYVKENGWPGFFGILAKISPHKISQEELKKYKDETKSKKTSVGQNQSKKNVQPILIETEVNDASIYAAEHIPAVQADMKEQKLAKGIQTKNEEQTKTNVLEPPKNATPNPWGEAKVVSPGELNLQ